MARVLSGGVLHASRIQKLASANNVKTAALLTSSQVRIVGNPISSTLVVEQECRSWIEDAGIQIGIIGVIDEGISREQARLF
jgi:hypothetical protein